MDENKNIEKLKEIFADKDFTAKVLEMETPEEVQKAISNKGVDLTIEEIESVKQAIINQSEGNEELSDDQLENVAGGFAISTAIAIAGVITGAVSAGVALGNAVDKWTRRRW